MRHTLFAHWGLAFLLPLTGATGCLRSNAAQPPSKPPPETPRVSDLSEPTPPDPGFVPSDIKRRETLLEMLAHSRLPLFQPEKVSESQDKATAALDGTFRKDYLPEELKNKLRLGKTKCDRFGCSLDVTYLDSDWSTFVAIDRAVLARKPGRPPSPFMAFPGPRYRTGRVKLENKTVATWILAFRTQEPSESQDSHWKEGR